MECKNACTDKRTAHRVVGKILNKHQENGSMKAASGGCTSRERDEQSPVNWVVVQGAFFFFGGKKDIFFFFDECGYFVRRRGR